MQDATDPSLSYRDKISASFLSFKEEVVNNIKDEFNKGDRVHYYSLFAIFLISTFIRIYLTCLKHMMGDEGVAVATFTMQPLSRGLTDYYMTGNHLLFTLLSHISWRIFGMEPWSLRMPALIAGILIVPASYVFIRRFYNKHAALLAAAFIASSPYLIRYASEARGYSIVVLFFMIILVIGTYLKQERNLFLWYIFALLSALGMYTVPIMLYPFGIVIVWLFFSTLLKDTNLSRDIMLKDLFIFSIITIFITFILYSPVIFFGTGLKSIIFNATITPQEWPVFFSQIPPAVSEIWTIWNKGIPLILRFFMVVGILVSLIFHKQLSLHRVPILVASVIWVLPVFIYMRTETNNLYRVWIFLLPLYLGLASSGIYFLMVKFIPLKYNKLKTFVFSASSIILVLTLGMGEVKAIRSVHYEINGSLKDPDFVTKLLKINYEPGDRFVYSWLGWSVNMEYNFMLHRYPSAGWNIAPKDAKRILLYVDINSKESLESALKVAGLKISDYHSPKILIHDKHAVIYSLQKLKDE